MLVSIFRHWLPILTFCPVNNLPDLIYVSITMEQAGEDPWDLYEVRRTVRKALSGEKMFMEDVAVRVLDMYPTAKEVRVSLAFNRHVVTIKP